jgi:DNA-directed RNA polymerase specialized sigma24 family protein
VRSEAQEAAYAEFVTARQQHLRRVAYAVCGDWEGAEALLGRALTRLYVAWSGQQRDGTEEVFVRRAILRSADDSPSPTAARPDPGRSGLFAALQSLPLPQRKVAVLRLWLGLSDQETADDLATTARTVESQAARARAVLEGAQEEPSADLDERLDASFGGGPPHPPVEERLVAGRRARRRRRRMTTVGSVALLAVLAVAPVLLRPTGGAGGGGIDDPTPLPTPSTTVVPQPVHLLVAPARYVSADTPPVLYLFGRMFRRDRDVTVLATFGEIDADPHPQGGAIVRVGGRTEWVLVVGNEPERLVVEREAPYDYPAFMGWAVDAFPALAGRLALAATAPGPYHPPVPDDASPAAYDGDSLVAKPGGTVVQRVDHPPADRLAVPPCHDQAVRLHTGSGDWFVLGYDCDGQGALYSEKVGVRADSLTDWLVRVKQAQDAYEH